MVSFSRKLNIILISVLSFAKKALRTLSLKSLSGFSSVCYKTTLITGSVFLRKKNNNPKGILWYEKNDNFFKKKNILVLL